MKDKIIARLRQIGKGYELDKLPPALLKAVIDSSLPLIEQEIQKAESKAIQKLVNERFVAKAIKQSLEGKSQRRQTKLNTEPVVDSNSKPRNSQSAVPESLNSKLQHP